MKKNSCYGHNTMHPSFKIAILFSLFLGSSLAQTCGTVSCATSTDCLTQGDCSFCLCVYYNPFGGCAARRCVNPGGALAIADAAMTFNQQAAEFARLG